MREEPGLLSTKEFVEYQKYLQTLEESVYKIPMYSLSLEHKTEFKSEKEELLELVIAIENY